MRNRSSRRRIHQVWFPNERFSGFGVFTLLRFYTQLDISSTGAIQESRQAKDPTFKETGGNVDVHSVTPEEVLAQANRIFSPYKIAFGAPLSWFAVWKGRDIPCLVLENSLTGVAILVSERVARRFSSEDLRVHLAGDAA